MELNLEYAPQGLMGVLTPQANTTVEPEMQILLPPGFAYINARLTSPKKNDRRPSSWLLRLFRILFETVCQCPHRRTSNWMHRGIIFGWTWKGARTCRPVDQKRRCSRYNHRPCSRWCAYRPQSQKNRFRILLSTFVDWSKQPILEESWFWNRAGCGFF